MHIRLYTFTVKEDRESEFVEAWSALTKLIYQYSGSLGSRLHHAGGQLYIGYAQWPDSMTIDNAPALPEPGPKLIEQMRATCDKVETVYAMDVLVDLTKKDTFIPRV